MPTISVIIPVYNVQKYIHRCVDSILRQTYADFELILVDDGSPDNCGAICDEYAAKDSRVVVIHQQNGGLSAARNAGLDIATGNYIYFLDSDDFVNPILIETAVSYLEHGTDMVVFNHENVYSNGTAKPCFHELGTYSLSESNRANFYINTLLSYRIGWEAWNRVFRRDIIERYHLRFADNRQIFAEDMYFNLCYCAHVHEIISIAHSLYCYTVREDSIMRQNRTVLNAGRMNELGKAVLQHFQGFAECDDLIDAFPTIHYLVVDNAASKAMWTAKSLSEYRDQLRENISDWAFFRKIMRRLLKKPKYLYGRYTAKQVAERLSITRYCLDGNYIALLIRNKLIITFAAIIDAYQKQRKN